MRAASLALAAVILAACQQQQQQTEATATPAPATQAPTVPAAPAPAAAPAAAALPAAVQGDLEARGTEPFWGLKLQGGTLTLERPDQPKLIAPLGVARAEGDGAVLQTSAENPLIRMSVRPQPGCSDGMSDLSYPLAVEVTISGETLKGCGAKAGEIPTGER